MWSMRHRDSEEDDYTRYRCTNCEEECAIVEDTFDYSGTHCTHGLPGTHHTGDYSSKCCSSEFEQI